MYFATKQELYSVDVYYIFITMCIKVKTLIKLYKYFTVDNRVNMLTIFFIKNILENGSLKKFLKKN